MSFVGASPDFCRPVRAPAYRYAKRETWRPQRNIPKPPPIDLIERMKRAAREAIEAAKPQIEVMLAAA